MASFIYNSFKLKLGNGTIDMDSDTFSLRLMTSNYVPAPTHALVSDLSGEVIGTGYTTGGKTLTGVTWAQSGEVAVFDADNASWTESSFTARYGVIADETATDDPLVACFDFGEDKVVTNGTFTINMNAAGIVILD